MNYLEFEEHQPQPPRKTIIVHVLSVRSGAKLAEIKWYGPWRQYAFFPEPATIWNPDCLAQVNQRIEVLMDDRRRDSTPA